MQIRDNIRRRRKARMARLIEEAARHQEETGVPLQPAEPVPPAPEAEDALIRHRLPVTLPGRQEPDPEIWWKQQQKQLNQAEPAWRGIGGLSANAGAPPMKSASTHTFWSRIVTGFAIRTTIAAVLFGIAWLGIQSEWPGNRAVRTWTINAISQDMDFQAALAWYERNFGGSPAFLPMFRGGETKAVFGGWKRNEAVLPVEGRIVRTFAQDGAGIGIAAAGGSPVQAVYAGLVMRVTEGEDGRAEVQIQHAGRTMTIYGNLVRVAVQPNDWVEAGQMLGSVPEPIDEGGESLLYFAVWNDQRAIDPAEVVPFG
jgi:stage IV sporulation protein FA